MSKVQIKTKTITSFNIIRVSAGTNCPRGGDAGSGGRTYFKLENQAATSLKVKVNGQLFNISDNGNLEIILSGDAECETFLGALEFAANILKNQFNDQKEEVVSQEIDIE
jgi:hypothetical protein